MEIWFDLESKLTLTGPVKVIYEKVIFNYCQLKFVYNKTLIFIPYILNMFFGLCFPQKLLNIKGDFEEAGYILLGLKFFYSFILNIFKWFH